MSIQYSLILVDCIMSQKICSDNIQASLKENDGALVYQEREKKKNEKRNCIYGVQEPKIVSP
jgi:hypothetical protein